MELLVVIAIIGILIALLLPAINAARESARVTTCTNNVRQMALACLALESEVGHLPGGGWGWCWSSDPDKGYGAGQPGGWLFNILPFMEYKSLHEMGKGTIQATKKTMGLERNSTAVPTFLCPTRHAVRAYPRNHSTAFINISDPMPRLIGRTDYAANAGDLFWDVQPGNVNNPPSSGFDWSSVAGTLHSKTERGTGVILRAGQLPLSKITDGTAKTYLIGERYLCPDCYITGDCCDNDQGWDMGYDYDTNRGTGQAPMRDTPGAGGCSINFGSAHAGGFVMAFCDASAQMITFELDATIHKQLGNRADGKPLSTSWSK